eukprot:1139993-Pelagomonas_calceolata.AAC.5
MERRHKACRQHRSATQNTRRRAHGCCKLLRRAQRQKKEGNVEVVAHKSVEPTWPSGRHCFCLIAKQLLQRERANEARDTISNERQQCSF